MSWFKRDKTHHVEAERAMENAKEDLAATKRRWTELDKLRTDKPLVHDLFASEIYKMIKEGSK